jgi:hypothetical protein
MRTDSSSSNNLGWLGLAIFTIVVGVFVLPEGTVSSSFSAMQVDGMTEQTAVPFTAAILYYGKSALKYGVILAYLWVVFKKVDGYLRKKKGKKEE